VALETFGGLKLAVWLNGLALIAFENCAVVPDRQRGKSYMLQRCRIVTVATCIIIFSLLHGSASATSHRSETGTRGAIDHSSVSNHWSKVKKRPNAYWSFYDDLSFYADPDYFLNCYQRTKIETLDWVVWRPVRICK